MNPPKNVPQEVKNGHSGSAIHQSKDLISSLSMSTILPLLVAIAAMVSYYGDLFWCSGRALPMFSAWRHSGFSVDAMPNLVGRTAVVTGASSGLGEESALQLALANATVILACRNIAKCQAVSDKVSQQVLAHGAMGKARVVKLDLADLLQVDEAASKILNNLTRLDILINNVRQVLHHLHYLGSHISYRQVWQHNFRMPSLLTVSKQPFRLVLVYIYTAQAVTLTFAPGKFPWSFSPHATAIAVTTTDSSNNRVCSQGCASLIRGTSSR
jgi:hypothetical protein